MGEINHQVVPQVGQTSVDRIKEFVLIQVILRIEPFFLQFSPYCFSNVQMWGIGWKKENVETSFLPKWNTFLNDFCLMYSGIIQNNKGFLAYLKRKIFHIFQHKLRVYIIFCCFPPASALSVYQTKAVEFVRFLRKDAHILVWKLPAIRDITFAAYMGFITIIQVYPAFSAHLLKFPEFLRLKVIMFCKRLSFGATSYPFISSAKLFKKALKVLSLTLLPLFNSHSALAVRIRCRLDFMASRTLSPSSSPLRTALRPRPGFVYKPDSPSALYRFSQLLTLTLHIPVMIPTSLEVRPSDFSRMLWQRIRKLWLLPSFSPDSNSLRCDKVRAGVFTLPIMGDKGSNNIN